MEAKEKKIKDSIGDKAKNRQQRKVNGSVKMKVR